MCRYGAWKVDAVADPEIVRQSSVGPVPLADAGNMYVFRKTAECPKQLLHCLPRLAIPYRHYQKVVGRESDHIS